MCEPSFGMTIQGTIRNLGLSITRRRFFSRRGAEAEHGDGPAVAVVYGVAHLGADQGLVVEAARRYIDRGFSFVAAGIDLLLPAKGAQSLRASFGEPA